MPPFVLFPTQNSRERRAAEQLTFSSGRGQRAGHLQRARLELGGELSEKPSIDLVVNLADLFRVRVADFVGEYPAAETVGARDGGLVSRPQAA